MRVLVCPDGFSGTMTALEASEAIAHGWLMTCPDDEIILRPMSDGGPGFVDAVAQSLGALRVPCRVRGPLGNIVEAEFALLGREAWIESAQACGLALVPEAQRNPATTSTFGLGELISAAISRGATRITIGLGGSATNDAGAGMLAALGATATSAVGERVALDQGGWSLREISDIDLVPAHLSLSSCEIVVASDVDNPLLGLRGATATYARQKGASDKLIMELEGSIENFARVCGKRADGKDAAVALGAGSAGGLGYALLLLGGTRVPGISTVMEAVGLKTALLNTDLVITGEGCLDDQSLHGKVVAGVARECVGAGIPCVAVAGQVRLGKRDCAAAGIDSAYSMSEFAGIQTSVTQPKLALSQTVARLARSWGRR